VCACVCCVGVFDAEQNILDVRMKRSLMDLGLIIVENLTRKIHLTKDPSSSPEEVASEVTADGEYRA
jgi:hypothetical protein